MTVTMVAPCREACGVTDYVRHLVPELGRRVDLKHVVDAERFTPAMSEVDLIHVQHQYFLFGGVAPWKNRFGRFADRLRAPAVMTVHEIAGGGRSPAARAAITATNRAQFHHPGIRRLIVHTLADRCALTEAGVDANRIDVVRLGVPAAPALPERGAAQRRLGLDDASRTGGPFVLTVFGFVARRKGHRMALEAVAMLPDDVHLLIAGGRHPDDRTGYVDELQRDIDRLGVARRARITGYLPESAVADVMAATDLILAPFTASSGSASLTAALACGKPILASDIDPHREILAETPGAVRLFASGSADALAAGVRAIRDEPERLRSLADAGARYAEEHNLARMADETVAVYRAALAETAQ